MMRESQWDFGIHSNMKFFFPSFKAKGDYHLFTLLYQFITEVKSMY